jgi:hypothetical protein
MGYEVNTEGLGSEWYEQGSASNAVLLEAFMTEGLFFEFVAGLELTTIIGCAINWIPAAKEIEIHGLHAVATTPESKNYTIINYTCTSEQSHTQKVNGPTTWTNNGDFELVVPAAASSISLIAEAADGDITLQAGDGDVGSLSLASNKVELSSAGEVSVTGTTKASMSSGAGGLNLSDTQVSLKCNTAGLTATADATTLSGAKVEIGVPGTPNTSQVATAATVAATAAPLDVTTAAINNLQGRLRDLQDKIGKSKMLSYLLK